MPPNDHHPDLENPLHVAVKLTALEGRMENLHQQIANNANNSTNAMLAMQHSISEMAQGVHRLAESHTEVKNNSQGLERAFATINENDAENLNWRSGFEKKMDATSHTITRISTIALCVSLFAGSIVALVTTIYRDDKINRDRDNDAMRDQIRILTSQYDQRQDHVEQVLLMLCAERPNPNCKTFR